MNLYKSPPHPDRLTRWLSWMAIAVLLLFGITLTTSFFTPIYFDDIGYTLSNSRAGYDGWHTISPRPLCGASFATPIPVTLIPGRWLAWLVHAMTGNFLLMRLFSLAIFIGWIGGASWLMKKIFLPQLSWLYAYSLTTAMAGIGVVPFLMMQSRPEAALLLAITFYVSLPFLLQRHKNVSVISEVLVLYAVLLVSSWFFSAHPKASLYLPLVLVSCCYLPCKEKWLRVVVGTAVLLIAFQAFHYWQFKVSCPGDPGAQEFRNQQALRPEQLFADPYDFYRRFIDNIWNAKHYINKMVFTSSPGLHSWTTPIITDWWMDYINWLIILTAIGFVTFIVVGIVWQVYEMPHGKEWKHPRITILLSLAAGLLIQSGIQIPKHFYESAFVWLCLLVLAGLTAMNRPWIKMQEKVLPLILAWIFGVSATSQLALAIAYIPATADILKKATPNGIVMDNSNRLSPVYYDDISRRIVELAKHCGINTDSSSQHVAVDSATYLALRETYQPFYLFLRPRRESFPVLQQQQSSGIVVLCRNLSPDIKDVAIKEGGLCCVSKQNLILEQAPNGNENIPQQPQAGHIP